MAIQLLNWLWLSTLVLGVLWVFYYVALRHERSFGYNRVLLVLAPLLAATLPLLPLANLGWPAAPAALQAPLHLVLPEVRVAEASPVFPAASSWLLIGYGLGVALLLIRLGWQLWQLRRFARSLPAEPHPDYTLRRTGGQRPTSSFGRTVFWDDSLPLAAAEAAQILAHELIHVRQHHTFDRLWLRVWQAVLWPIPFVHLLPRAVHLTHEYLADVAVASPAPAAYIRLLARQVTNWLGQAPTLTHTFLSSTTLTRIAMLHETNAPRRWKQWLALPLGCALLGVVACEKATSPDDVAAPQVPTANQSSMPAPPVVRNAKGEIIYFYVDQMPEYPGGMGALLQHVGKSIRYPEAAKDQHIEGKIFVSFTIAKEGSIENVNLVKGIEGNLNIHGTGQDGNQWQGNLAQNKPTAVMQAMNEEALRVVREMPRWKPGTQDGQPMNVAFTIPISYALK